MIIDENGVLVSLEEKDRNIIKNTGTITLHDDIKAIGDGCFRNTDPDLKSIVIPDNVAIIGKYAFQSCTFLESVIIHGGVKVIRKYAFYDSDGIKRLEIGSGVRIIEDCAFCSIDPVEKIFIPKSVEAIGERGFGGNPLSTIYCEAESKPLRWDADWSKYSGSVIWGCRPETK